jgi:hypothetical protein
MTGSTFSSLIIFLSSLELVKNIGKRLVKGQKMLQNGVFSIKVG